MKLVETFTVAAPRDRVWAFMTDPELMGACIPACQGIEVTGPTTHKASVVVKVGPIEATFNLEVEVTEEACADRIVSVTRGEEGTRASIVTSRNFLHRTPLEDGGTEVAYGADVSISGRLGKYGHGVMKKIAKKLANKFAEDFREKVELIEA
jgi:hypothetical protein